MRKIISIVFIALTLGFAIGASAAANNETVQALMSYSMSVEYNGEKQEFKDVNGKIVHPILYEGTTYLPVRAVCNMLDLDVEYDADRETVIVGENYLKMDNKHHADMLKLADGIKWEENESMLDLGGKTVKSALLVENININSKEVHVVDVEINDEADELVLMVKNQSVPGNLGCFVKSVDGSNERIVSSVRIGDAGQVKEVKVDVRGVNHVRIFLNSDSADEPGVALVADIALKQK